MSGFTSPVAIGFSLSFCNILHFALESCKRAYLKTKPWLHPHMPEPTYMGLGPNRFAHTLNLKCDACMACQQQYNQRAKAAFHVVTWRVVTAFPPCNFSRHVFYTCTDLVVGWLTAGGLPWAVVLAERCQLVCLSLVDLQLRQDVHNESVPVGSNADHAAQPLS